MWIDTHCHLSSLSQPASEVLEDAHRSDVDACVCVGTDVPSSASAIEIARVESNVWATVGLHPHDAQHLDRDWPELEALVTGADVVAVGETGLDFHYNYSPRADQLRSFRAHIELARRRDLALVVHVRDAWDELFNVFDDVGVPDRTVLHCFTGGPDELDAAVGRGCFVSFSGILSFKNAEAVRDAARRCPADRMLVETDSPYLAPIPHRGSENRPAYVAIVGAALAAARGESSGEVAAATSANARTVFRLDL